jgi:LacI family transcriptional regulator
MKRPIQGVASKVTLGDVALAANVSPATVSRALNMPSLVRGEVRDRINQTIATLGYLANGAARALASKRSGTLGAVVPTLKNAIFVDTIDAYQRRLEQSGYVMLLTTTDYDPQHEFTRAKALIERGVDGLMLVGHRRKPELLALLHQYGIPFVDTWVSRSEPGYPAIGYDGHTAGAMVVRYLLSLGHRDFAFVMGDPKNNERMVTRLDGMKRALAEANIPLRSEQVLFKDDNSINEGREALRQLLSRSRLPTAIVCGNDVLALSILLECQRQGIDVPGQLSITGFGDVDLASQIDPGLTTVRSPRGQIGDVAAEYLLARIEGRQYELPTALEIDLVVRGTTAAPRGER